MWQPYTIVTRIWTKNARRCRLGPIGSKKSQSRGPHYQRYGEPKWYCEKVTFPEGRDPYTDLFKDEVVANITKDLGALADEERHKLQADLRDAAFHYLSALYTTPFRLSDGPSNLKLSARVQYLKRHVINPAAELINALAEENLSTLSEWPGELSTPTPNRDILLAELKKLHDRVEELRSSLDDRLPKTNLTQEFLTDLGHGLSNVLKSYYPDLNISRGTYVKTEDQTEPTMHGTFIEVMKTCVAEILPSDKPLSSKVVGELRKLGRI